MPYLLRDTYGQEFPVTGMVVIGRDPACQIRLSDPQASRRHASVWEDGGRLILRDENSRNGTFINGQRVRHVMLQPGDQIRIGDTTLVAAAYPGGMLAPNYGQAVQASAPVRSSNGLTRGQAIALIAAGVLLLCVLLAGGLMLTYPYLANNLTFLPHMAGAPVPTPEGTSVVVLATSQPQKMLSPAEYQTTIDQLAQAIEALNLAELRFIQDGRASTLIKPGISLAFFILPATTHSLDADLCEVAAQAMDVSQTAESLMQTAASQAEGSQIADKTAGQYASIARLGYALVVEAQNLRLGLQSGEVTQAKAVNEVAEYGAQLWNPAVTRAGVQGNPFLSYVDNTDNVAAVQFLNDNAVAALMSQSEPGNTRLNWLATTAEEVTKTVNLPPPQANDTNLLDPNLLQTLTTASGQVDANLVRQVAVAKLVGLVPPNGQNQLASIPTSMTFSVFKGVAMAGKKMIQDMQYPSYPQGSATSEEITTAENLVSTQIELQGDAPPIIGASEPIKQPNAGIRIKLDSVEEKGRRMEGGGSNTYWVTLSVHLSWEIYGYKSPMFTISCDKGPIVHVTTTRGSLTMDVVTWVDPPRDTVEITCTAEKFIKWEVLSWIHAWLRLSPQAGGPAEKITDTDTPTLTQTLTQTLTLTPLPTLDHKLETEVAAEKTAEFLSTVTEIARQTEKARANGVYTLNGTFGTETNASACFPGTHSSGLLSIIVDFGQKLASGKLSGAGNVSSSGISCNGMTYDLSCSFSYNGTFNGTIDPTSGALAGVSGPDTTISSCQYSNCKTNGVASACPGSTNGASIPGTVTLTGTIDKTSLTGKGNISVCPGCRGDWSAGQ